MTHQSETHNQPVHPAPVGKRMLLGAGIGLLLISFFLIGATKAPEWSAYWWIRPLLVVPAAGALGGLFFYNMDHLRSQGGWRTGLANVLSLLVFIVVLWLGTVLGLAGTMWD